MITIEDKIVHRVDGRTTAWLSAQSAVDVSNDAYKASASARFTLEPSTSRAVEPLSEGAGDYQLCGKLAASGVELGSIDYFATRPKFRTLGATGYAAELTKKHGLGSSVCLKFNNGIWSVVHTDSQSRMVVVDIDARRARLCQVGSHRFSSPCRVLRLRISSRAY